MFEVRAKLSQDEFASVENLIFESEGMENWNLYENFDDKGYWAQGVFESEKEAVAGKEQLELQIEFNVDFSITELVDDDWKESYKEHFHPWSIGHLHWVPLWLKGEYALPAGDEVVWLDPGMAFGTGNHGTTRLCVEQLIAFKESGADPSAARVVDAGCGSGILAISASKLGFERVEGFDIDGEAVRIADENAACNGVSNTQFSVGGLEDGLSEAGADCLMANILVENAERIRDAVAPGGWLILSGILGSEAESVKTHFESIGGLSDGRITLMDEWSAIRFIRG